MIGEILINKHAIQMKKELTELWKSIDERKQRRYVGIVDSINLQLAFLDQELQLAKKVDQMKIVPKKQVWPSETLPDATSGTPMPEVKPPKALIIKPN